ncbi:MAG: porin family protein, partial [Bacteroidia bacterium]|nr:porin family protein [Bacteroidia bacterium]
YKISDKKLDLSIIGGFSTLFLNENEVYSSLQGQRMLLGEATNIKKTSFSANLGLGVKYEMSERFNLNLEPVLKYHLNTFSDTSGDFNPYFIGVYTGFSFKF